MVVSTQQRIAVLAQVDRRELTAAAAAAQLELSERQSRRLIARYREGGAAAVQHGNRGRQPAHTLSGDVRQRVIALAQSSASGYSTHRLSRLLAEREGLKVSRSSVRRILLAAGLPATRSPSYSPLSSSGEGCRRSGGVR
jgi:transposase